MSYLHRDGEGEHWAHAENHSGRENVGDARREYAHAYAQVQNANVRARDFHLDEDILRVPLRDVQTLPLKNQNH